MPYANTQSLPTTQHLPKIILSSPTRRWPHRPPPPPLEPATGTPAAAGAFLACPRPALGLDAAVLGTNKPPAAAPAPDFADDPGAAGASGSSESVSVAPLNSIASFERSSFATS